MAATAEPTAAARRGHLPVGWRLDATAWLAAACVAVAVVVLTSWVPRTPAGFASTDFATGYASAQLLLRGEGAQMYDPAAEQVVLRDDAGGASITASVTALPPPAVAVLCPLTLLPLWLAGLVWSLLQVALLGVATAVAIRASSWPANSSARLRAAVAGAAMCGGGTLMLLPLNQWDGVGAAALALTYAELRRGRDLRAMVWLTAGLSTGKPQLAVGLGAFLVARRPLSLAAGALTAAAAAALTMLVIPFSAVGQWAGAIHHVIAAFPPSAMIGFSGLAWALPGGAAISTAVGWALSAGALIGCVWLGRRAARRGHLRASLPGPLFLAVTMLSLLMSPHVFPYDLVLLIPGFVGCVAWIAGGDTREPWPGRRALLVLAAWLVVELLCFAMVMPLGSYRPMPLLPALLLAGALVCVAAVGGREAVSSAASP